MNVTIIRVGDMLAVPFFLLAFIYFYILKTKTSVEYILLIFSAIGFLFDAYFTIRFLQKS
jgi:hypothetical protein